MLTLAPTAFSDVPTWLVGMAAFALSLVVLQPLPMLIGGALALVVVRRLPVWLARRGAEPGLVALPFAAPAPHVRDGTDLVEAAATTAAVVGAAATLGLGAIFVTFLKLGLVVFGSGYVLVAFLGADLVEPGYITEQQLLDAIAIGQLTPGPVFTTATFIGYLLAGVPGAIVATIGIFLPAIVLVGLAHPWLDRIRANATLSAAIEGLNAAAIGLIGASIVLLARDAFLPEGSIDIFTVALGLAAFAILVSGHLGPVPLLLTGAVAGFAWQILARAG
jgi:chromate transporter